MAAKRRKAQRPAKPAAQASRSVTVSPRFTLFGGSLISLHRGGGGGGRGGRRRGGLLKRLGGLATNSWRELAGGGSPTAGRGPAGAGRRPSTGGFAQFKDSRPDLFDGAEDQCDVELDDVDDVGSWPVPSEHERWEADEAARMERYRRGPGTVHDWRDGAR